jgi:hypothetical protein
VGRHADVYSFGVLLWQMLTGSRPWPGMSHAQIMAAVGMEKRMLVFPPKVAQEGGLKVRRHGRGGST